MLVALSLAALTVSAQTPSTPQPAQTDNAKNGAVAGKVVDAGGEPLIGAQVRWKDTKTGVVSDADGNFVIPRNGDVNTIVVSYIGYKSKEINVKPGSASVKVTMDDDAQSLDELVVVGYGIQKKSSLTGSIETIKSDDIVMAPTTDVDKALTGQVAGLQVMQTTGDPSTARESDIHIRGINGAPLLVIDGVPRFGTNTSDGEMRLSDLNPDDIESISILKDAAAAAVYGARAANGVILVQTKQSKGDRVHVNYRGQYNVTKATQMPEFLNAYEYALLFNRAVANTPGTTEVAYTDE